MIIVIASKSGQLGNRLFQFAHFISYAEEYGVSIYNPSFCDYSNLFESTSRNQLIYYSSNLDKKDRSYNFNKWQPTFYKIVNIWARFINRLQMGNFIFKTYILEEDESLAIDYFKFHSRINFVLGWRYNAKSLVVKHRKKILQFLEFKKEIKDNVDCFLKKIDDNYTIIGIHIRRGDYKTFEGGKYYFGNNVYQDAMYSMAKLVRNPYFIISSNNEVDLDNNDLKFIKAPGSFIEDLIMLSKCKYIIGPPSTYSMWASFYGDVPLFQLKKPFSKFNLKDFNSIMVKN